MARTDADYSSVALGKLKIGWDEPNGEHNGSCDCH
jgi:hypothetical protein